MSNIVWLPNNGHNNSVQDLTHFLNENHEQIDDAILIYRGPNGLDYITSEMSVGHCIFELEAVKHNIMKSMMEDD